MKTEMSLIVSKELEQYASEHSTPESDLFRRLAKETYTSMKDPQMQVGRLEGGFLRLLARLVSAQRILEIGTFTGYSGLAMAEALPEEGTIITCDIDPKATSVAQKFWDQSPHGKKISLKLGPALETIKTLDGFFDMVFIDADKENYINYWEEVLPKVRRGGILVADNVLWSGRVLHPKDSSDFGIVRFNEHVQNDSRVESVLLTVRDGITVAMKKY